MNSQTLQKSQRGQELEFSTWEKSWSLAMSSKTTISQTIKSLKKFKIFPLINMAALQEYHIRNNICSTSNMMLSLWGKLYPFSINILKLSYNNHKNSHFQKLDYEKSYEITTKRLFPIPWKSRCDSASHKRDTFTNFTGKLVRHYNYIHKPTASSDGSQDLNITLCLRNLNSFRSREHI